MIGNSEAKAMRPNPSSAGFLVSSAGNSAGRYINLQRSSSRFRDERWSG